jgi:hypothetical protein
MDGLGYGWVFLKISGFGWVWVFAAPVWVGFRFLFFKKPGIRLGFGFFQKLLSIFDFLAVGFVKFSIFSCLCNVGFLKNLFVYFHNCCNFKLNFGPTFENLTFNFGAKFAKFLKDIDVF